MKHTPIRRTSIAAVVRAEMSFHEVSTKALSEAIDMPVNTLRRRLRGVQPLTLEDLDAICVALGMEVEDVLRRARERQAAA
ncbi:MAG: helix-turn-helix transcriptional regulator [Mycetocola sp.]